MLIFRYRRTNPVANSTIELIRGTTTDSKTDYRLGNYDGSFKVKLAVNNYEEDVLSVGETSGIVSAPFGLTTNTLSVSALITAIAGISSSGLISTTTISASGLISTTGNISASRAGIGVSAPTEYRLEVATGTGNTGEGTFAYFNPGDNASSIYVGNWNEVSVKFNGRVWGTSYFISSSDSRIKEDIQDINDDSALQSILAIKPTTYKYIDKVEKGDKKVYGFIAQQIREVIPDATSIQTSYIPNIMLLADYDNNIITLPSQPTKVIIKLNDKIRCYDRDNKEVFVEIEEVIDGLTLPEGTDLPLGLRYKIKFNDNEFKYTNNKIFVYGTEIDDFHTISKEYIFTLNVCATQELHRRIISQEERIKELETKLADILKYLSL